MQNLWETLRRQAAKVASDEPTLQHLVNDVILSRDTLAAALGARLARRLAREDMPRGAMEPLLTGVFETHSHIVHSCARDLLAMFERDPACFSPLEPLLFFKGFLALTTYRVSHQLWQDGRRWLALYLQSVASEAFAVDIHPVNPFDFTLDPSAASVPFSYDALSAELAPYRALEDASLARGPRFLALLAETSPSRASAAGTPTIAWLVELNRVVAERTRYVLREELGIWTPEETLSEGRGASSTS